MSTTKGKQGNKTKKDSGSGGGGKSGDRWEVRDTLLLKYMRDDGKSVKEMSQVFERSENAIKQKISKLDRESKKDEPPKPSIPCPVVVCKKEFPTEKGMNMHFRRVHKDLICPVVGCKKKCKSITGLKNHGKVHKDNGKPKVPVPVHVKPKTPDNPRKRPFTETIDAQASNNNVINIIIPPSQPEGPPKKKQKTEEPSDKKQKTKKEWDAKEVSTWVSRLETAEMAKYADEFLKFGIDGDIMSDDPKLWKEAVPSALIRRGIYNAWKKM
eukprot:60462_1